MTKRIYGWKPDHPDYRDLYFQARFGFEQLPQSVDLRDQCSPVEDQKALASCTANALVGAMEFLHLKKGYPPVDLSRLFIYYNERALHGQTAHDWGATLRDGVKTLVKRGVCEEGLWPYDVKRFAEKPPQVCYQKAKFRQLESYHRVVSLNDMRSCLAEGYPFVFGFSVYESFESDKVATTGVVPMPKKSEAYLGGHAVMAVGYDDRLKCFIVRNSWGSKWGQKGYCLMSYSYLDNDDLATDLWTLRSAEG